MKLKHLTFFIASLMAPAFVFSQQEQPLSDDLYVLSLEELMNVPINSASKKDETLFDAPLSSYTITRADIDRAGSTSIMEALRLAPGVIVREQTNGVYDIHIRGFDNLLRSSEIYTKSNLTTLVMIDNRPVFNHNLGGTFWEALPIDIHDVERIEIVRGPSAPLFGPNAVTGVINIITKRIEPEKTMVHATAQVGTPSTTIARLSVGKNFGKFSAIVSGNYQDRERFDNVYYLPNAKAYYTVDELSAIFPPGNNMKQQYPDPYLAMQKFGVNTFLAFEANENVKFDLSLGLQESETQKIFSSNILNGGIFFTNNQTETKYANLSGKIYGFSFRTSKLLGHDNIALKATPNQYDYDVFDVNAEYAFQLGKLGTLVPGVNYQRAVYGDKDYKDEGLTFLNGKEQTIQTTSGYLRTDLKPTEAFRILAAVRVDKFSVPDDAYFAYEFAATYKLNETNLIRAAVTQSNSGSFIGNNYLEIVLPLAPGLNFERLGTTDLKLVKVQMIEVGYRAQLSTSLQFDIDVFQQKVKNLTALFTTDGFFNPSTSSFQATEQRFLNVPTKATQVGTTLSLNFVPNDKIQIKPFLTIQKTKTEMIASSFVEPGLSASLGQPVTYRDADHENTPAVYGGYYLNYKISKSFIVNLNGYFLGAQHQYDGSDLDGTSEGDIKGKLLFNAKVSYTIWKINMFINGRNIFNNDAREFLGADKIGGLYTIGASFDLNR